MPAAFIATTSLCWLSAVKAMSVPKRTAKGRKREISSGRRSDTYCHSCASLFPGTARIFPDSPSRSSVMRMRIRATRTARLRVTNSLTV